MSLEQNLGNNDPKVQPVIEDKKPNQIEITDISNEPSFDQIRNFFPNLYNPEHHLNNIANCIKNIRKSINLNIINDKDIIYLINLKLDLLIKDLEQNLIQNFKYFSKDNFIETVGTISGKQNDISREFQIAVALKQPENILSKAKIDIDNIQDILNYILAFADLAKKPHKHTEKSKSIENDINTKKDDILELYNETMNLTGGIELIDAADLQKNIEPARQEIKKYIDQNINDKDKAEIRKKLQIISKELENFNKQFEKLDDTNKSIKKSKQKIEEEQYNLKEYFSQNDDNYKAAFLKIDSGLLSKDEYKPINIINEILQIDFFQEANISTYNTTIKKNLQEAEAKRIEEEIKQQKKAETKKKLDKIKKAIIALLLIGTPLAGVAYYKNKQENSMENHLKNIGIDIPNDIEKDSADYKKKIEQNLIEYFTKKNPEGIIIFKKDGNEISFNQFADNFFNTLNVLYPEGFNFTVNINSSKVSKEYRKSLIERNTLHPQALCSGLLSAHLKIQPKNHSESSYPVDLSYAQKNLCTPYDILSFYNIEDKDKISDKKDAKIKDIGNEQKRVIEHSFMEKIDHTFIDTIREGDKITISVGAEIKNFINLLYGDTSQVTIIDDEAKHMFAKQAELPSGSTIEKKGICSGTIKFVILVRSENMPDRTYDIDLSPKIKELCK